MESITSNYQTSYGDIRLAALDLDCLPTWNSAIIALGGKVETVGRPEYLAACEAGGWGRAEALIVAGDESLFYISTLRGARSMHGQLVSGFHAPVMVNGDIDFLHASMEVVESYWQQQNVAGVVLAVGEALDPSLLGMNWSLQPSEGSTIVETRQLAALPVQSDLRVQCTPNLARSMDVFVEMARECGGAGYEALLTDDYAGALLWEMGDLLTLYTCDDNVAEAPRQAGAALWSRGAVHVMLASISASPVINQAVLSSIARSALQRGIEIIVPSFAPPMCPAPQRVDVACGRNGGHCLATWKAARQNAAVSHPTSALSGLFASFAG